MVVRLAEAGPMSITKLAAGSKITRQAITKHLHVMEEAGLVRRRSRGRESVWQLRKGGLEQARHYLDIISKQWDEALERFRAFVEE